MLADLKAEVCRANKDLAAHGLVMLTWGNVSGYDPDKALVAIKPSGVAYDKLTPETIVIVDLDGKVVEGKLNPSPAGYRRQGGPRRPRAVDAAP